MSKRGYKKIPYSVRKMMQEDDYWHSLSEERNIEMPDGTMVSLKEYKFRFDMEWYGNGFSRTNEDENILQTEEQKKEARRNNNSLHRDALAVADRKNRLNPILKPIRQEPEEEWYTIFKTGKMKDAATHITQTACDNLKIELSDKNIRILTTYFVQMRKFIKVARKAKRTDKERNNK